MEIFTVDAFATHPFTGNPAGVCFLETPQEDLWMLGVAREMNLSETAFLLRRDHTWHLRWFTPQTEVDLCGHATLATAHILREKGFLAHGGTVCFQTRSGTLVATVEGQHIVLDFPIDRVMACPPPEELLASLGIPTPRFVGKNTSDYLVEVASEAEVRSLVPDFSRLAEVDARGTMVTARSTTLGYDFVSRFFAPRVGVPEDPVTGSAHCALGPYWGEKIGKDRLSAWQASARGGRLDLVLTGPRILLKGQAVTIVRGTLAL